MNFVRKNNGAAKKGSHWLTNFQATEVIGFVMLKIRFRKIDLDLK